MAWRGRIYSPLPFIQSLTAQAAALGRVGHGRVSDRLPAGCASAAGAAAYTRVADRGAVLLAAGVSRAAGKRRPSRRSLPLAAGVAGAAITLFKCAAYARRSDIDGLPLIPRCGAAIRAGSSIARPSPGCTSCSRLPASYGHARGLAAADRVATAHRRMLAEAADADPATPLERALSHLLVGKSWHGPFWSEAWTSGDTLLTRIVERLRAVTLRAR